VRCSLALLTPVLLLTALTAGCTSSKWAMDDPDYRDKYARPYADGEKTQRMAKQIVDARHVAGKGGVYLGAAVADEPTAVGGEIGVFGYPTCWLEGHAALAGLLGAGTEHAFGGLNAGLRAQPPTRLAPFVGMGTFLGYADFEVDADDNGLDDDDDLFVDERGETESETAGLAAIYPEVGLHYWLTSTCRLTGSGAYYVTTEGRDQDFWFVGLSIATLWTD